MPENADIHRKIVHVDMDAFFASVEQRDFPELKGKPVAVGGSRERGVVAAASYEARTFGVRSAMPSVTAKRKCPELIFVKPRFDVYRAVSEQIREIFAEYTDLIEPLSLDEAYLDVTCNFLDIPLASDVAAQIRDKIFKATGLTASAGISYNKFLAKMASDQRKPNGQFSIPPGKGEAFIEALPIKKFHGVGPATAEKLQNLNITTGADLRQQTEIFLTSHLGKFGSYLYLLAQGIDNRAVQPNRERKSVGAENTFFNDLSALVEAKTALDPIIDKVVRHCENKNLKGRTITLKVKYNDFEQITRSRSVALPINSKEEVTEHAFALLESVFPFARPVRLLGVTMSSFETPLENQPAQMALFG